MNLYLISYYDRFIAIDAGNDPDKVLWERRKLYILPEQVGAVLLTHSDADHTAAIPYFLSASVYLPEDEKQLIDGRIHRFLIVGISLDSDFR